MRAAGLVFCLGARAAVAATVRGRDPTVGAVNCTPGHVLAGGVPAEAACKPPFSCNNRPAKQGKQAATDDGHPDWSTWCGYPENRIDPPIRCYNGNLTGYGYDTYALSKKIPLVPDSDCQYCMGAGHCGYSDDSPYPQSGEVTETTTLAEMVTLCDTRFGKNWTTITFLDVEEALAKYTSFPSLVLMPPGSIALSQLSCATATYHCDTIYCRDSFCTDPKFAKWKYLRPNKTAL